MKTNIGHLEAAAGIAGVTKVLLQMKHQQLAPSLHADQVNSNITFEGTPFRVQRKLEEWRPGEIDPGPRRAGISSFGAGGANAFVVVEEFVSRPNQANGKPLSDSPALIVLSARNGDRLEKSRRKSRRISRAIFGRRDAAGFNRLHAADRQGSTRGDGWRLLRRVELISFRNSDESAAGNWKGSIVDA